MDFLARAMQREGQGVNITALARKVQRTMQRNCLVEKSAAGLDAALQTVLAVRKELDEKLSLTPETLVQGLSVRNLAQTSELVLRACLNRKETRSAHYRVDYPERDDAAYLHSYVLRRDGEGIALARHDY